MNRNLAPDRPLISVVVPAFNAAQYIERTLQALASQSYENLEIIVVDDGSRDATVSLVRRMKRRHPQIRLIQQPNMGVAAARNRGVRASRGEYIAPVDADDIWFPETAEKLINVLVQSNEEIGVAYGWSLTIDEFGQPDGGYRCSKIEGRVFRTLICHNFLGNASCTMIRRNCFDLVGGYDSGFHRENAQGCEDWDLYLRLATHTQFRAVHEFLLGYRRSASSISSNTEQMAKSHGYLLQKVARCHPGVPRTLLRLSKSSFYLYLAQESRRVSLPRESIGWLVRAMVQSPLLTLIRPEWYRLAAANSAALIRRSPHNSRKRSTGSVFARSGEADNPWENELVAGRKLRIRMTLLLQDILHSIVR